MWEDAKRESHFTQQNPSLYYSLFVFRNPTSNFGIRRLFLKIPTLITEVPPLASISYSYIPTYIENNTLYRKIQHSSRTTSSYSEIEKSDQVLWGIRRSSASPHSPYDGTLEASIRPTPRQTPGPSRTVKMPGTKSTLAGKIEAI